MVAAGLAAILLPLRAGAGLVVTTRVSVDSAGGEANDRSEEFPAISADGCSVAFASRATNLVTADTNGLTDVFVHERCLGGVTSRVSVDDSGSEADGASTRPAISGDGRFVAFQSGASNLVPGDTNGADDVFLHDLWTGATTRVSVGPGGVQASGASAKPAISTDGRFIAFESVASNLVPGDTNGLTDIFVHDREAGTTTRASVSSNGAQADASSFEPALSADGRVVTFFSPASNLVPGDTNNNYDVFVHDIPNGLTTRASVSSAGVEGNSFSFFSAISGDGRLVVFESLSSNLVEGDTNSNFDVFAHDLQTGATTRVSVATDGSQGNNGSYRPAVSFDGRFVAFHSFALNLVSGDTNGAPDVFVRDRTKGKTARVSVNRAGRQGLGPSFEPALSDGLLLAYRSGAPNLVPADTNAVDDIFVAARPSTP